jgi:type IV pilus assembly protein PilQ
MKNKSRIFLSFTCIILIFSLGFAQEKSAPPEQAQQELGQQTDIEAEGITQDSTQQAKPKAEEQTAIQATPEEELTQEPVQQEEATTEEQTAVVETLTASQNVTLDFKEADIRNVLKIISYKSGVNIITTPEVMGNVTIRLVDVPWENALDVILKTYGFAYEKKGNIITVAPIDKLTTLKKQEVELAQVQPTATEVFNLKYIDAQDAKRALDPQLSPRGKITVLDMTGQSGWEFGTTDMAKRKRLGEERMGRSKILIISDIPPALDKIKQVLEKIDVMPQQVLIEARIMEVNRDKLKDIGFDWGTGSTGAESSTITVVDAGGNSAKVAGGHILGSEVKPSSFNPKASIGGIEPYSVGLEFLFRKLTGTQFEVILHALEEDVNTNTLSAPRILALNNQEASILVGTKYPIIKSDVSTESAGQTISVSLDYYQDIGIQLNVVPQVGANNYINMIVHPAVTSSSTNVSNYPIIETREAETRVLMRDGETVVIGGLLKDVKSTSTMGVPFLSKIPLLGLVFRRNTVDTEKLDLLVFISAHIIKEGEFAPEEISKLEERLDSGAKEKVTKKKR